MNSQKVIFVPGHGVPEAVRSVRLTVKLKSHDGLDANPKSPRLERGPEELELWNGDFYGWHSTESATRPLAPARIPSVFVDGNWPVVAPGKSIVAVVRSGPGPHGWQVEFESEFANGYGEVVNRRVTFDDSGTACEKLSGLSVALAGGISGGSGDPSPARIQPADDSRTS